MVSHSNILEDGIMKKCIKSTLGVTSGYYNQFLFT